MGEGQTLGNRLDFGGPSFGFFAAQEAYLRRMPGRIAGETTDVDGRRGFVLTLQTRDAYADQLGMGEGDLACVVGSAVALYLHETRTQEDKRAHDKSDDRRNKAAADWGVDEDGNPPEEMFDAIGEADAPPPWLEHFLMRKPRMRSVIMTPVLVCTVDHLIKAGEPTEQGNYALTNVRPYKQAWTVEAAKNFLIENSGTHFDPQCVEALLRRWSAVLEIRERLGDGAVRDAA